jgi:hypothetical protein
MEMASDFIGWPYGQSPATQPTTQADKFRNTFAILHNLDTDDLAFLTAEQRLAFFKDPVQAILKLDDARLDALYALVESKQPERYR